MGARNDRLSEVIASLLVAVDEASLRSDAGDRSAQYLDLLGSVRELHIVLLEVLLVSEPNVDPITRQLADLLGHRIDQLQAVLQANRRGS
jgi:hypothetical protein